jgi:hypothetical protein
MHWVGSRDNNLPKSGSDCGGNGGNGGRGGSVGGGSGNNIGDDDVGVNGRKRRR